MIVGISGLAGSGKDTCADFLVRDRGFAKVALADPLKRIAADVFDFSHEQLWGPSAMRNAPDERYPREHSSSDGFRCDCCGFGFDLFPLNLAHLSDTPQCYLTPRFALQKLGTEWGRSCYPNVWIDYAARVAKALIRNSIRYNVIGGPTWGGGGTNISERIPRGVVVPDVRFKNEVDSLRAHGAKLIRVVRSSAGLVGAAGAHTSETEQASIPDEAFDTVIRNDGTIAELGESVTKWLKESS